MSEFNDVFEHLVIFMNLLNNCLEVFFIVLRFAFTFIMLALGTLILKDYRGMNINYKSREQGTDLDEKEEFYIILAVFYFSFGFGILLGYLSRVLMIFLDFIPDNFLLVILDFFFGLENIIEPYITTIYYAIGFFSLIGFTSILIGLNFMILHSNKSNISPFKIFFSGNLICLLFGFTSFMSFF